MSIIVDGKVYKYYPDDFLYVDGKRVKEVRADGNLVYPWEKVEIHKTTGIPDMVINYNWIYQDFDGSWGDMEGYPKTGSYTLEGIQFDTTGDIYVGAFKKPRVGAGTYHNSKSDNKYTIGKSADLYDLLFVFISEEPISQNSTEKIEHNGHTFYFADITYPTGYEYFQYVINDGSITMYGCDTDFTGLYTFCVGKSKPELCKDYYGYYTSPQILPTQGVALVTSCPGQKTAQELYSYLEKATETDIMVASGHYWDMIHAAYDI